MHRTKETLEALWSDAPPPPRDEGTLVRVVARKGDGVHEVLDRGVLTAKDGLVGDRWYPERDPERMSQLSLMNATVVDLIGGAGPDEPHPGDNLILDLDLSAEALPAGALLEIGTAVLEITPKPHTGCNIFASRFGVDALKWVNGKPRRHLRLRGIHARVVQDGEVSPGDPVRVVRPATPERRRAAG